MRERQKIVTQRMDPAPDDFYAAFRKVIDTRKTDLPRHWQRDAKARQYTALMLGDILPAVARELGICYYDGGRSERPSARDYYLLDAVFYREIDQVHFKAKDKYVKYISVAIEHENEYSSAGEEMNKLQLFNVPLTVLITYPPKEKRKETLDKYSAIIRQADILENASATRWQLAILGPFGSYDDGDWEAFVYRDGGFVPVPVQSPAAGK